MTDHTDTTMSQREEWKLDYLERIAIALEKIAEQPAQKYAQFIQDNQGSPSSHEDPPVPGGYAQIKLCGNDDPDIPEKAGPCIRPKHHSVLGTSSHGGHKDKAGGEW